ncbi:NADH:ubiquinone reductase (Na(+)-transporting) subunit B [Bacteriovoracaceae bacterium]|nr:NADH:ubiquinone reductase (Na(+)-transporting) subunit B [Bacteriovoracaceae bacterium]
MKFLENIFEKNKVHFENGGKLSTFYPIFEMIDTFIFTPRSQTVGNTHVRDGIDLKRTMVTVAIALLPVILFSMYNTGYQSNLILQGMSEAPSNWRYDFLALFGLQLNASSHLSNIALGALYFVPIFLVTNIVGGFWEVVFSVIRKHEINEGFLVTGILFPLTLPASIPLWQVAIGISFGVVFGKEVFGGTGRNIFNPALMARAFLFFAYPAQISGEVWVAVDGHSGATMLGQIVNSGFDASSMFFMDAFLGFIPGSIGETSTLAILFGASYLLLTGVGSWRIMLSMCMGLVVTSVIMNTVGSETNDLVNLPFYWHMVMGSFAFACVYMATDPVSATMTNKGRFIYGFLIGVVGMVVRVSNPAYPEGWMLAVLFMNAFSPLIDYFVMQKSIKKRIAADV